MKDDKKSIIKEALTDYNEIKEAANANAHKKLAEEFPEKFNNILKEELQNKNKHKESYKKLDDVDESEESDDNNLNDESSIMKNQKKETEMVKETIGKGKSFEKVAPNVDEDVKITNTVGKGKPFEKVAHNVEKVEEDVKIINTVGKSDPFKTKTTSNKTKSLQTENYNLTELDMSSTGMALEGADEEDEIYVDDDDDDDSFSIEDIEKEISEIDELGEELKGIDTNSPSYMEKNNKGIAFNQLVDLKNQLDEILNGMNEMHAAGNHERFGSQDQISKLHGGNPLIDEDDEEISIEDVNNVLGNHGYKDDDDEPVEESLTQTYGNLKKQTANIPSKEYKPESAINKMRYGLRESEVKVGNLIQENKILTKKLNETKKYKQSMTSLVEQYKTALEKYRNQLKEMATFNTNLAHVNNLLVNESLALTQDDKIKIIGEFKKVNSITESQNRYNTILNEMMNSKKSLTESLESKVSTSIQSSSKQKLDEVIEKTAYENNEHIQKIKKLIGYVEHRGKKIIK